MKYLVVLFLAAACSATPVQKSYGAPAATVVQHVVPLAPPAVRVVTQALPPAPVPVLRAAAPAHLPFVPQPAFFNPAPLPLAAHPVPVAAAPIPAPLPLAAAPVPVAAPLTLAPAPVIDVSPSSQFHAQDEFGGFSFGYQNGQSAKQEVRTADGVTRGTYSYVDANGLQQTVEYIADPVNGFRVAGTNIPVAPEVATVAISAPVVETPEVMAARAEFEAAYEAAVLRNAAVEAEEVVARKKRSASYTAPVTTGQYGVPAAPVVTTDKYGVPAPVVSVPVVAPEPAPVEVINVGVPQHVEPPMVRFLNAPALAPRTQFFQPAPVAHAFPRVIPAPAVAPIVAHPAPVLPQPAHIVPAPLAALPAPTPIIPQATPLLAAAAPVPVPATTVNTQFQAQDEAGGYSFGYENDLSARHEVRSPDGVTRGAYSYVDANGKLQRVEYTADAVNGFQVVGTNIPVAPAA